jgi:hypothetical protein
MSLKGVKMEKNWHAFNVIKIYKWLIELWKWKKIGKFLI